MTEPWTNAPGTVVGRVTYTCDGCATSLTLLLDGLTEEKLKATGWHPTKNMKIEFHSEPRPLFCPDCDTVN